VPTNVRRGFIDFVAVDNPVHNMAAEGRKIVGESAGGITESGASAAAISDSDNRVVR
jgi:hypothetical protein